MAHHQLVDLPPEQIISPSGLKSRIQKEDIFVIDVRNPSEIESSGSIKTKRSINIPFPDVENALNLSNEIFKTKYGVDKPSGEGSDVVFHCGRGARGSKAVAVAEKLGLNKAQNLDGGYTKWVADGCAGTSF